eukprot:scaffold1505_cov256-Pinguiococcus_pyrenoidosus.AAC.11
MRLEKSPDEGRSVRRGSTYFGHGGGGLLRNHPERSQAKSVGDGHEGGEEQEGELHAVKAGGESFRDAKLRSTPQGKPRERCAQVHEGVTSACYAQIGILWAMLIG